MKHLAEDPALSTNVQHPYVPRSEHHQFESNRWHEDFTGSIDPFHVKRHATSHGPRREPAPRGFDDGLPAWVGRPHPAAHLRTRTAARVRSPPASAHPSRPAFAMTCGGVSAIGGMSVPRETLPRVAVTSGGPDLKREPRWWPSQWCTPSNERITPGLRHLFQVLVDVFRSRPRRSSAATHMAAAPRVPLLASSVRRIQGPSKV